MRTGATTRAIVLVAVACTDTTGPTLPPAERFDPPPAYGTWWGEVGACSKHAGDLGALRFYRVRPGPGEDSLSYRDRRSGRSYYGEWDPRSNSVYLAAGQVSSSNIVRHEMLHALLHTVGHPRGYFDEACGPLVAY